MTDKQELDRRHRYHTKYCKTWAFYKDAYEGTEALVTNQNVLPQHPRESDENYRRRKELAYGFGYSAAVIELLTFYLFQQPAVHEWGTLAKNELFLQFLDDADLYSTDFDVFLIDAQKSSAIQGHAGILVDKPNTGQQGAVITQAEAKASSVYPYVALYDATCILDWKYERVGGRPMLTYLKLLDTLDDSSIEQYRIWTLEKWKVYQVEDGSAKLIDSGDNPLSVIPFVWLMNARSDKRNIGVSDLKEVSRIDASVIRNLSQIEEITDYAAFPMLMKPYLPPGEKEDDVVGVTAVIEFDPAFPQGMPQWMESKAKEPIDAIMTVLNRKAEEIYRAVNAGGLQATEVSTQVKSGIALQQEFRMLNAKLASKSSFLEEAEKAIIEMWLLWEEIDPDDNMLISRPKDFNISDLMADLENVVLATSIVNSETYDKQVQKIVVRKTLSDNDDYAQIDKEIDEYIPPEPPPPGFAAGEGGEGTGEGETEE